jgi:ribosomal protein L24E
MWLIDYVGKHKNCVFVHDQSTEYDGLVEVHRDGKILKTI